MCFAVYITQCRSCNIPLTVIPGGRGRGYSKKFYTGRLRPEVQPLTLLYTIFSEKAPLSYTLYWEKAPLLYTFLRRLLNKSLKQEVFLSFLNETVISCICLICFNSRPFLIPEQRFSYPFIYLNLWNPYPFIYLKPEKGTLSGGASPYRPL